MKCTTGSDSADARTTKKKKRTSQIEHYDGVFRRIPMLAGADIIRVRIAATVGKQTTNQAPACTGVRCLFVFDCVPFSASPFPPTPSLCLLFPDLFRACFLIDCFVLSLRIQSETLHLSPTIQFHVLFPFPFRGKKRHIPVCKARDASMVWNHFYIGSALLGGAILLCTD